MRQEDGCHFIHLFLSSPLAFHKFAVERTLPLFQSQGDAVTSPFPLLCPCPRLPSLPPMWRQLVSDRNTAGAGSHQKYARPHGPVFKATCDRAATWFLQHHTLRTGGWPELWLPGPCHGLEPLEGVCVGGGTLLEPQGGGPVTLEGQPCLQQATMCLG